MFEVFAAGLVLLWGSTAILGLLGKRFGAAIAGGMVAILAGFPFVPRLAAYLIDRERFIASHGEWVVREVAVSAVCVTFALFALVTTPLATRKAWGWLVPAFSNLFPVALLVWLAFWFSLF